MTNPTRLTSTQEVVQNLQDNGSQTQTQSNLGNQTTHLKNQNVSSGYEYVSSNVSSPYSRNIGSIPVIVQPNTVTGSPNQYYAVPASQNLYQGSQYFVENSQFSNNIPVVAIPTTMLSPTLITSPQMSSTYASYGFIPTQHLGYTTIGTSSPVNASKPSKYSTGCC